MPFVFDLAGSVRQRPVDLTTYSPLACRVQVCAVDPVQAPPGQGLMPARAAAVLRAAPTATVTRRSDSRSAPAASTTPPPCCSTPPSPSCGTRPPTRCAASPTPATQRALRQQLQLSFGKVIEYQHRGLVRVRAVIRIDGPDSHGSQPPPWAHASLLRDAVLTAATVPSVTPPHPGQAGQQLTLTWGRQADPRIVRRGIAGELDDHKVAAYIGKYATKGTENIGGLPRRIKSTADLDAWHVTPHARRLITACRQLGQREEHASLRLARWAHQLGYRGPLLRPVPPLLRHPGIPGGRNAATPAPHGPASTTACPPLPA